MSTPEEAVNHVPHDDDDDEMEFEEISVEITDDNFVWVHGSDWEIFLAPDEARDLAAALKEAADDAENPDLEETADA